MDFESKANIRTARTLATVNMVMQIIGSVFAVIGILIFIIALSAGTGSSGLSPDEQVVLNQTLVFLIVIMVIALLPGLFISIYVRNLFAKSLEQDRIRENSSKITGWSIFMILMGGLLGIICGIYGIMGASKAKNSFPPNQDPNQYNNDNRY